MPRAQYTAALTLCVSITVEAESEARRFAENMGPQGGFIDGWNSAATDPAAPRIIDCAGPDIEGAADMEAIADLAEAAEGDECAGCGRASIDCSREPCRAVMEDRRTVDPGRIEQFGYRVRTYDGFMCGAVDLTCLDSARHVTPEQRRRVYDITRDKLRRRAALAPDGSHVVYDPADDEDGWLLVGAEDAIRRATAEMIESNFAQ